MVRQFMWNSSELEKSNYFYIDISIFFKPIFVFWLGILFDATQ